MLINVLFGLFYYVDRLVNGLQENGKKLKPLLFSNVILCLLLSVVVIAWYYGWVEQRDTKIKENSKTEQMIETYK